jgi:ADP-ribose pyrophosphatase
MVEIIGRDAPALADRPAHAFISEAESVGRGYRPYERFKVEIKQDDGSTVRFSRDILKIGHTVGIIAIDLKHDEIVLIRQFRLSAHTRLGTGEMVEIPAGYVDGDETPATAAHRECVEEIGVTPHALRELFTFMPAPGMLDEHATIFLAAVDATRVPDKGGAAGESELTHPIRVHIDEALAALNRDTLHSGYLRMALLWLALNRARLPELLRET